MGLPQLKLGTVDSSHRSCARLHSEMVSSRPLLPEYDISVSRGFLRYHFSCIHTYKMRIRIDFIWLRHTWVRDYMSLNPIKYHQREGKWTYWWIAWMYRIMFLLGWSSKCCKCTFNEQCIRLGAEQTRRSNIRHAITIFFSLKRESRAAMQIIKYI